MQVTADRSIRVAVYIATSGDRQVVFRIDRERAEPRSASWRISTHFRRRHELLPILMRTPGRFEVLAIVLFALIAGFVVSIPATNPMRGWTLDALTTLRWYAFGERRPPHASSTVVIALDEETYSTPPFKGSPIFTWTGDIGRVVSAAIEARVVGFNVVFASSIRKFQIRFGDDTLGAKLRGFDRDYLRALASGGRAGKIVLGETESGSQSISPTAGQRLAVGGRANLRSLNVHTDVDLSRSCSCSQPTTSSCLPWRSNLPRALKE